MLPSSSKDLLVVKRDGASLVGISGHQVATLSANEEVRSQGERGPYTIVSWQGRMGFVLSDDLSEYAALLPQSEPVGVATAENPSSSSAGVLSVLLIAALAVAAAASTFYALFAM